MEQFKGYSLGKGALKFLVKNIYSQSIKYGPTPNKILYYTCIVVSAAVQVKSGKKGSALPRY